MATGTLLYAQGEKPGDQGNQTANEETENWSTVRFSNSENPELSFIVNTNIQDCLLHITTNYPEQFTIRFIDYWGKSVRVYRHIDSGMDINVSEFKDKIMILNIMDEKSSRLLSSQVVNLKRRNYWPKEG